MECRGHLREVASLIAGSAAERLAPRVEQAKGAVAPKVDKAREAALNSLEHMVVALGGEKRKSKASWPMMLGMLALGLAAGVVGARMLQRRHQEHHWHE